MLHGDNIGFHVLFFWNFTNRVSVTIAAFYTKAFQRNAGQIRMKPLAPQIMVPAVQL